MIRSAISPIRPTIIKMMPTASMLSPATLKSVAKVRIAPIAIRKMLRPMSMRMEYALPVARQTPRPGAWEEG
jgi:hypothetical protein